MADVESEVLLNTGKPRTALSNPDREEVNQLMAKAVPAAEIKQNAPEDYTILQNADGRDKHVWEVDSGIQHTIYAHEVRAFPDGLAKMFLDQHPRFVHIQRKTEIHLKPDERAVWIANVTGNPHAKDEVDVSKIVDGKERWNRIPNPHRKPQALKFRMHQDQIWYGPPDDRKCLNPAPFDVHIPPYERVQLSANMADTILNRSMFVSAVEEKGKVRPCRAPGQFEPNVTWQLDDIRMYANIVDGKLFSLEALETTYKAEASYAGDKNAIAEAKLALLHALFFCLIDDAFSLPTREGFERKRNEVFAKAAARRAPMVVGGAAATA